METRQFRFIKHMLWPVKTTVSVGPEGITNKGSLVAWDEIDSFCYGIHSVNRAMNYIIAYDAKDGKSYGLNFLVTIVGRKKRKMMMADLYAMLHEGFSTYCTEPRARQVIAAIANGETVTLQGCEVSQSGIEIPIGMTGKKRAVVAPQDVQLSSRDGVGGFHISSAADKKVTTLIGFRGGVDSRCLLAVLNQLYPERALDIS